jgi:ubiquinone/menaquinone biosynthesis C-methylase UbiE
MKNYRSISKNTFDNIANTYEQTYEGYHSGLLYPEILDIVKNIPARRILDVGCGSGNFLKLIENFDAEIFGIDFSEPMLEFAKKALDKKVKLVLGDAEKLPWEDSFFDVVICLDSFHHYPRPNIVLKEMKRVLSDSGTLVIADPYIPKWLKRQIVNLSLKFGNRGDVKIYSQRNWKKMLYKAGFRIASMNEGKEISIIMNVNKK